MKGVFLYLNYNGYFDTKVSWCIFVHHSVILVHFVVVVQLIRLFTQTRENHLLFLRFCLAQTGQPAPLCRLPTDAFHSCPHLRQSHQAFWSLPDVIISGVCSPFFNGCHSFARLGFFSANVPLLRIVCSFFFSEESFFAQLGQPFPLALL